jgi:hypothetical protein
VCNADHLTGFISGVPVNYISQRQFSVNTHHIISLLKNTRSGACNPCTVLLYTSFTHSQVYGFYTLNLYFIITNNLSLCLQSILNSCDLSLFDNFIGANEENADGHAQKESEITNVTLATESRNCHMRFIRGWESPNRTELKIDPDA